MPRNDPIHAIIGALLLAGLLADPLSPAWAKGPNQTQEQNRILSQGYAQLYQIVSGLKHLDKANYVKVESDKLEAVNEAIASSAGTLADQLEQMAEDYPSLDISETGLPEIERKKRKAIRWDRFADLAPIVGKTGKDYERALLVTELGLLNSVRFLIEVTKEEEKDRSRAAMLAKAKSRFDELFNRVQTILEKDHFCS